MHLVYESKVYVRSRLETIQRAAASRLLEDTCTISFGDLFPLPSCVQRVQSLEQLPAPVPLSWQQPKGATGTSFAERNVVSMFWSRRDTTDGPRKRLDDYFYCGQNVYRPRVETAMRNAISVDTGRVDSGNLFSVEQISAGTRFAGRIWFEDSNDANLFLHTFSYLISGETWLGIGRGRKPARVVHHEIEPCLVPSGEVAAPKEFALHLISDCVTRNEYLEYNTTMKSAIETAITNFPYADTGRFEQTGTHRTFSPVGGLPGFPSLAIKARSSYWFKRDGNGDDDRSAREAWAALQRIANGPGLGEHTSTGMGRFVLEFTVPEWSVATTPSDSSLMDGSVKASSREEMFEAASKFYSDYVCGKKTSSSQWQRLISVLEQVPESEMESTFREYLARNTLGGRAWDLYRNERAGNSLNDAGTQLLKLTQQFSIEFLRVLLRYQAIEQVSHGDVE